LSVGSVYVILRTSALAT